MPRARTCSSFSRCFLTVCLICVRHDVLAHAADLLAQPQRPAIVEADVLVARLGVDLGDLEAVAVAGPLVREREQVGALA